MLERAGTCSGRSACRSLMDTKSGPLWYMLWYRFGSCQTTERDVHMATVEAISPPWEGALAYKIDRSMDERGATYEITESGPWDGEPDKIQWVDPVSDLDCLMLRNHFGAWCGYVGVPVGHPAYGVEYDAVEVDVHGGLTFADKCSGENEDGTPSAGICHVPLDGRPHDVWWQGFDCGHGGDFQPGLHAMERKVMPDLLTKYGKDQPYDHEAALRGDWMTEKYRTMAYVRAEVTNLAGQLARLAL